MTVIKTNTVDSAPRVTNRKRAGSSTRSGIRHVGDVDTPWIPLAPLTDEVFVKYWKIDPVGAEIVASIKMPQRVRLPAFQHTGLVVAHTISGVWRCRESNRISRAGDTVYGNVDLAGTLESFEDTEIFVYVTGELVFLGDDQTIHWRETAATSIDRYQQFCTRNCIPARDLTGPDAPAPGSS